MEQITQESHDSPSKSHALYTSWGESLAGQSLNNTRVSSQLFVIHTLPAFMIFVSALLTLSFIILILCIFVGISIGNSALHPNPFAAYEAVWPGQSIESVSAYAQRTPQGYLPCITGASPVHHAANATSV